MSWQAINDIPQKILPITKEVVDSLSLVFGKKLKSVYLTGSYAQGTARAESDVDFCFVLKDKPLDIELEKHSNDLQLINKKWCPKLVYRIDADYVYNQKPTDHPTIRRRFIMQLSGRLLWGTSIKGDVTSEYSPAVIAASFRELHLKYIPTISTNHPDDLTRTFARRAKAKYLLRDLEWIAVMKGAPLSCTTSQFVDHIKQHSPEHIKNAELCWQLYQKHYINNHEMIQLESKQDEIVSLFSKMVDLGLKQNTN